MAFNDLYEILRKKEEQKMIIGVTGFVGSGKTHFAKEFSEFLKEKNIDAIHFNMDIYNSTTRTERNSIISSLEKEYDPYWPKKAYAQNYVLIRKHLKNIKQEKSFSVDNLCDSQTKELNFSMSFSFNGKYTTIKFGKEEKKYKKDNLWVICDGVKIMEHREFFDCIIFLEADYKTRFNRLIERNKTTTSPANIKANLFRDVDAGLSRDHNLNKEYAHIIMDNNDFYNRKINQI